MNFYIILFLLILVFEMIKSKRSFSALQNNMYNEGNRYIKWLLNNVKALVFTLDFLAVVTILIAYLFNNKVTFILVLISSMFYLLEGLRILNKERNIKKNRLVVTKRIKRLMATSTVITFLPIILYFINRDNMVLVLLIESILTYFNDIIVLLCLFINYPVDYFNNKFNRVKAERKMETLNKLDVIGIAGSYGKTITKNILDSIFSTKYTTKKTPRNLNTEHSLVLAINKYLDRSDQIFIAEMGAYKQGEIRKQCNLVNPKYAVITSIDLVHIDTFGSLENIVKAKFELVESLPYDGVAVLNMDDINQSSYNIKNKCKKIWIGIDNKNADIVASNISYSNKGSKFTVKLKNDKKEYLFETKLLGKYNVYNILSSIALGLEYGFKIEELNKIIKDLKVPDSKLELIDLDYMYELNDLGNNNPLGVKYALEVLDSMDGVKVIVTSGMFKDDAKERRLNQMFGNQIAGICDYIILVNSKKSRKIFDGIMENGYDKDRLFVVNDLDKAYSLIQEFKENKKIYTLIEGNLEED